MAAGFSTVVTAIGRCRIDHPDGSTIDAKMLLFGEGGSVEAQKLWKKHSTPRPPVSELFWGNGFALYTPVVRADTLAAIGVMALRCGQTEELGVTKIPADVDGCWFLDSRITRLPDVLAD